VHSTGNIGLGAGHSKHKGLPIAQKPIETPNTQNIVRLTGTARTKFNLCTPRRYVGVGVGVGGKPPLSLNLFSTSQLHDLAVLTPGKAPNNGRLEDREGKLAGEDMLEKRKLLFGKGVEPRFDRMRSSTVQ
jgi:hypothetical protein